MNNKSYGIGNFIDDDKVNEIVMGSLNFEISTGRYV